jgi:hypothetical protein
MTREETALLSMRLFQDFPSRSRDASRTDSQYPVGSLLTAVRLKGVLEKHNIPFTISVLYTKDRKT